MHDCQEFLKILFSELDEETRKNEKKIKEKTGIKSLLTNKEFVKEVG